MKSFLATLFCCAALLAPAIAAASPLRVSAAAEADTARVSFDFAPPFHLFADVSAADSSGAPLAPLDFPFPEDDPEGGPPILPRPFTATYPLPANARLSVTCQGCDDSLCYPPETFDFDLSSAASADPTVSASADAAPAGWQTILRNRFVLADRRAGYLSAGDFLAFLAPALADAPGNADAPPPEPAPPPSVYRRFLQSPAAFLAASGLPATLLLILLGGFLLNLTPCVLPMIPVNLAIIGAGASPQTARPQKIRRGLVYAAGMALAYGALGLVVLLTGAVFGSLNASPLFNAAIALLFLLMGLAMLDLWQFDLARFRPRGAPRGGPAKTPGLPAVFAAGALVALLGGACVAPVVAAVLALASALYASGAAAALLLPFLLGLGMAAPWPLAAAGLSFLPRPGAWMARVKTVLAVFILLLAVWYAFSAWRLARPPAADPVPSAAYLDLAASSAEADLAAALASAAATGRPLLLDFTASWCKNCHAMEKTTLRDPAVRQALSSLVPLTLRADRPAEAPARAILADLQVPGFPDHLLYIPRQP